MKFRVLGVILLVAVVLVVTLAGTPSSYFCKSDGGIPGRVLNFEKSAVLPDVQKMFLKISRLPPATMAVSAFDQVCDSRFVAACRAQPFLSSMVGLFITVTAGALCFIIHLIRADSRFN